MQGKATALPRDCRGGKVLFRNSQGKNALYESETGRTRTLAGAIKKTQLSSPSAAVTLSVSHLQGLLALPSSTLPATSASRAPFAVTALISSPPISFSLAAPLISAPVLSLHASLPVDRGRVVVRWWDANEQVVQRDTWASFHINTGKYVDTKAARAINTVYRNHLKVWLMFALISGRGRNLAVGVRAVEKETAGDCISAYEVTEFISFSAFSLLFMYFKQKIYVFCPFNSHTSLGKSRSV